MGQGLAEAIAASRTEVTLIDRTTKLVEKGIRGIGESIDREIDRWGLTKADIIESADEGNANSKTALKIYCYRLKKYIASYAAVLGRLDAVIFTAGIGENSSRVRRMTCENMEMFGIKLDDDKNEAAVGCESDISAADASVRTLVIPTNEELVIARDTLKIVEQAEPEAVVSG